MLPVVWLREADAELNEALVRYGIIRPELADRFAAGVLEAVDAIAAAPLRYAVVARGGWVFAGSLTDSISWWKRSGLLSWRTSTANAIRFIGNRAEALSSR